MYKNPELSAQSKRLRAELKQHGVEITHAQAMELMARVAGNRTLHVAQARKHRQGADINELALKQTSDLVFETLGCYEGNVLGLLEAINAAYLLEDTEGSRAVEAAVADIFEHEDSPKVSDLFDRMTLAELPEAFEETRQCILRTLEKTFDAPVDAAAPQTLYRGPAFDWRVSDGFSLSELPEHHRTAYQLTVKRAGHQLFVDVTVPHDDTDGVVGTHQLALNIEVNEGRPCVHVSNDVYGEMHLSIFGTRDGLLLRPEAHEDAPRTGVMPEGNELRTLQEELDAPHAMPGQYWFIPTDRV